MRDNEEKIKINGIYGKLCKMTYWAILEKSKQGDRVVCEDMEIPEVLEKDHVEIPGLSSNGRGISRGVQEKLMFNFLVLQGLHFWIWNFQGIIWYSVTLSGNSAEFPGVRACFL